MLDLLAFAPHPDDAELGAGGILAAHAARGLRVGVVDLTAGETGENGDAAVRAAEAAAAARILGLAVRENLGLPDARLAADEPSIARVVEAMRRHRPRLVLAPYWDDPHPDHRAASELVAAAAFKAGLGRYEPGLPAHRPRRVLYYFINTEAAPSLIVDVSAAYGAKEAALAAHRSQFERAAGRAATPVNDPTYLRRIRARDARWGAVIGAEYGEGLLLKEPLALPSLDVLLTYCHGPLTDEPPLAHGEA